MARDYITHINPESILVVTNRGQLKRLRCPFQVLLLIRIDDLTEGEYYIVRLVVPDSRFEMAYIIQGQGSFYPFYAFKIL